jgi:hypothetical protein
MSRLGEGQGVEESGCVLVRPDRFVAWRALEGWSRVEQVGKSDGIRPRTSRIVIEVGRTSDERSLLLWLSNRLNLDCIA